MDEIKVDYRTLYEAVSDQRNRLADSEARLAASVKVLMAKIEAMQRADAEADKRMDEQVRNRVDP